MASSVLATISMPPVKRSMRLHSAGAKADLSDGSHCPFW